MARILCIEDSGEFQIYLSSILREHSLTFFGTIESALRTIKKSKETYNLILLDMSLPDGNGVKALPTLRDALGDQMLPCIVISSDTDTFSKVAAFGVGADDYICKPPDSTELRVRVEAKLRWSASRVSESSIINFEDLTIDSDKMTIDIILGNGTRENVNLTPLEFKILKLLLNRPDQVFSRDIIIDRIWGVGKYISERTIDAHVSHIRNKISQSKVTITTVLGSGYKISKQDND